MKLQLHFTLVALMLCLAFTSFADPAPSQRRQGVIVFVDGQPCEVPFTRRMTLTKAILEVGGYVEFSQKEISLERNKTARSVDLQAIIDGRAADIMLEPWDIITIGLSPHS